MAGPTFATAGTPAHTSLANNLTLPLPASLVAGNILLGHIMTAFGGFRFTWPVGWTEIDFTDPSNFSASYAWYRVLASNAAPNVLLNPASGESIQGQLIQIQGVTSSAPIGNFNKLIQNAGAPTTVGGSLTTAGINSLVIDLEDVPLGTPATPSGYSAVSGPNNGMLYASVAMPSPGTTPAISYDAGGFNISADFQVEILAGPIPHPKTYGYLQGG
jgi:hypothetical protein